MLLREEFLRNALFGALLACVACGVVGPFVVVRRIGYIAGGISHTVLGGMGIALFLGGSPLVGALVAALIAAVVIGLVTLRSRTNEDLVISALWSGGMALGVLFIARTPGYNVNLMSYLFGNILMIPREGLYQIALLDLVIVGTVGACYKYFVAVCFDEEFARLRGVPTDFFYLLLLGMVAITCVILVQIVGLILVIALLTLPAAIARGFVASLDRIVYLAVGIGCVVSSVGLAVAYQADLPAGATIILLVTSLFLLLSGGRKLLRTFR